MQKLCILAFLTVTFPCFLTATVPLQNPTNPTVVLVPGAWHSPQHYLELQDLVKRAGYDFISHKNPSCDSLNPNAESASNDATSIRNEILIPLLDAGNTVILVSHSYGGSPGAASAKGLSKPERVAAGKPGGIIGLIFICAILPHEGQSLVSLLPGQKFDPWVIEEVSFLIGRMHKYLLSRLMDVTCKPNGQLGVRNPKQVFYGLVRADTAQNAISLLKPQSRASLSTPSGPPAWMDTVYNGRRAYWVSLEDKSIPSVAQEGMLQGSGVQWAIKRFPSDHSPFLSYPQELASWMIGEMRLWQGLSHTDLTFADIDLVSNLTEADSLADSNVSVARE